MTTLHRRSRHASRRRSTLSTLIVVSSIVAFSRASYARPVFVQDDFKVETAGHIDDLPEFTLIKVGVTIPSDGYVFLTTDHSLEFLMPCKGWVPDQGIFVVDGCIEERRAGDTLSGPIVLTREMGCPKLNNRVILLVRIPRMFITADCRPTELRWAGGYYREE